MDRSTGHATELVEESKQVEAAAWNRLQRDDHEAGAAGETDGAERVAAAGCAAGFLCVVREAAAIRTIVDAAGEPLRARTGGAAVLGEAKSNGTGENARRFGGFGCMRCATP